MIFSTYKSSRWFGLTLSVYHLQGDEFIISVIHLFKRSFKIEWWPKKKIFPHRTVRFLPYVVKDGKKYSVPLFEKERD